MDKRKTNGRVEEVDEYAVKRRKRTPAETPEAGNPAKSPQELGETLIALLEGTSDRRGLSIVDAFQVLPNKRELPGYYKAIKRPVALETIKSKLPRYKTFDDIVVDFELMVTNAQNYNRAGSAVYNSSLKIRNAVNKFITDIAKEEEARLVREAEEKTKNASEEVEDNEDSEKGTLKDYMLDLIKDLTEVKDANDEGAADHFLELPLKRRFADYYEAVPNPTSITIIRRKIKRGECDGDNGLSKFEEEVLRLFSNAELYNAKGSEILDDAKRLKACFKPRMKAIRQKFGGASGGQEDGYNTPETSESQEEKSTPESDIGSPGTKNGDKAQTEENEDEKVDITTDEGQSLRRLRGRPPGRKQLSPSEDVAMPNGSPRPSSARQSSRGLPTAMDIDSPSPRRSSRVGLLLASPAPSNNIAGSAVGSKSVDSNMTGLPPRSVLDTQSTTTPAASAVLATPARPILDPRKRLPDKTVETCPIRYIRIFTSPRIRPNEQFDIKIYPDRDLVQSSHTFHLSSDNSVLHLRPYMSQKIFEGVARYNILVNMNGVQMPNLSSAFAISREGAPHFWELQLKKGVTNVIDCVAEMMVQGQPDVDKTQFLIFAYVAPQHF